MRLKFSAFILLFVFGSVLTAQAQLNKPITIKINRQKTVVKKELTIKFLALVEDSRCPTDAQCIQAGSARIRVKVEGGKRAPLISELITGTKSNTIRFAGYAIKLIDLNPKPATNIRINRNGYTATFTIGKF